VLSILKETAALHHMAPYSERPTRVALADLVVGAWIDPPAEERHPVLPNACIDLVWDGAELRVAGPDTRPFTATSQATFVGIRFRPGAAPGLLGVPASDLLDQNVALRGLWGKTADERAERLADSDLAHAPRLLEDAILADRNVSAAALAALFWSPACAGATPPRQGCRPAHRRPPPVGP
jgi:hypothetical protein